MQHLLSGLLGEFGNQVVSESVQNHDLDGFLDSLGLFVDGSGFLDCFSSHRWVIAQFETFCAEIWLFHGVSNGGFWIKQPLSDC